MSFIKKKIILNRRRFLLFTGLIAGGAAIGSGYRAMFGWDGEEAAESGVPLLEPELLSVKRSESGLVEAEIVAHSYSVRLAGLTTDALTYNQSVPGKTLRLREGEQVRIKFINYLNSPTNLHIHGLHIPPKVDNPFKLVIPGESRLYEFTVPKGSAGTYWYHPHPHGMVSTQQFAGLSGAIVVEGELDKIPELEAAEEHLLVLKDFDIAHGQVAANHSFFDWMGKQGKLCLVNGIHQPKLVANKSLLRFRLVNTSNARPYRLRFDNHPMYLIATDGGFIEKPIALEEIILTPGERAEILVSLKQAGTFSLLRVPYDDGNFTVKNPETPEPLLTVTLPTKPEKIFLPTQLADIEELDLSTAVNERSIKFGGTIPFKYTINDREFDHQRVDINAKLNTLEIWEIENENTVIHPFHLHTYGFQLLARQAPESNVWQPELFPAWRDTVNIPGKEKIKIAVPFRHFTGKTVFHCHISEHEDKGMMGVIQVKA